MIETAFNEKKIIISVLLFGFIVALFLCGNQLLRVRDIFVMCDVGQGDGMYLRSGKVNIVIDAGKQSNAMSNCLSRYIPYFDKTIDLAFITNSDIDHYGGYFLLLDHYDIKRLLITNVSDGDPMYQQLIHKFKKHHTTIEFLYATDTITLPDNATVTFLWPTKKYIERAIQTVQKEKKNANDVISIQENINSFSQVFLFKNSRTSILFTGDVSAEVLKNYLMDSLEKASIPPVDILKLAHHGSKNGITQDFVKLLSPRMAIVSAGYHNVYKHPSVETVQILDSQQVPVYITFEKGDIRIDTQNESFIPSFFK